MIEDKISLPELPFFPTGWYVVAFSNELAIGKILPVKFMGTDLVIFRLQSGEICVFDAYCPHMGAHFAYGGTFENDCLKCPFHGFTFDIHGNCISAYGKSKPASKLKIQKWVAQEKNGMIFVYYDIKNEAPKWEIPAFETEDWMPYKIHSWTLPVHPQETNENSVDFGHFNTVHGYELIKATERETMGPVFSMEYEVYRKIQFAGTYLGKVQFNMVIRQYGLGYSFVDITLPFWKIQERAFVLSTPVEKGQLLFRIALSVKAPKIYRILFLNHIIFKLSNIIYINDVLQDIPIWQHKKYVQPPILAVGDGPIVKFRRWAQQFYN